MVEVIRIIYFNRTLHKLKLLEIIERKILILSDKI